MSEKQNILVIEDNEAQAMIMSEALKETMIGNEINVLNKASDALKFLNKQEGFADKPRPNMIILDLKMPDFNGFELLQIIKKDPRFASIPVIVLSASDDKVDIEQAYALMANCYITKPANIIKLKRVVTVINDFWLGIARLPPKE